MFTLCGIVFLVLKFKPNLVLYYEDEEGSIKIYTQVIVKIEE
jgi:hypothetical protein